LLHKGHISAEEAELMANPRARSAKLRAVVRTSAAAWGRNSAFVKAISKMRAH
jgi:16S rRNA (cytosine1402-N4)-methyltransferase